MTVASTVTRITYAGDGVSTAFPIPFYFLENDDLVVLKVVAGVSTTLVLTTDYTLSGAGVLAGGSMTALAAPAIGATIIIYRDPDALQLTDYQANDPFPAETHERALDKLTMLIQRAKELLGRSLTLADSDVSTASLTLPSPVASNFLGWNALGTAIVNYAAVASAAVTSFWVSVLTTTTAASARAALGVDTIDVATHAAVSKATPVDADEMPLVDSAASFGLKKVTWANIKATLKTYFDTLYTFTFASNADYATGTDTTKPLNSAVARARNLVQSTTVATTSGTSIDFTGIPTWVKRITIMFNGVSTNGTSIPLLQIGNATPEILGYLGCGNSTSGAGTTSANQTIGFAVAGINAAANVRHGAIVLTSLGANIWVAQGVTALSNTTQVDYAGGSKTTSGTIDRIRLTTVSGVDTFDAGSVNIIYE